MKKSILILLFFPIIVFSQTTNTDYELYSIVINEIIKNNEINEMPIEKLFIIKQYRVQWELDEIQWIKMEIDSMGTNKYGFPNHLLSESMIDMFYKETELRESITGLYENYNNHPVLELEKFNITNHKTKIKLLRSYYFFKKGIFRPFYKIKNKFKKKRRIYKIAFSRIYYKGGFASFYYSFYCGDICGYGGIITMENIKNKWYKLGEIGLWDM